MDYNQLKLLVLKAISGTPSGLDSVSLQSKLLDDLAGRPDIHAVRMALMRYHKQGLLDRERAGGRFLYRLSDRGVQRLRWLESQHQAD